MTYQTKSLLLNVEGFRLTIRNVNVDIEAFQYDGDFVLD